MTNELFPIVRGLDWGCHRRPKYATQQQQSANMKRVRCMNAQYPIQQFDLTWSYLKDNERDIVRSSGFTDFEELVGFFHARHGSFESFLFKLSDVTQKASDSHVDNQLIGTGDGALKNFQLVRGIGSGNEAIQAVDNLVVRVNGVVIAQVPFGQAVPVGQSKVQVATNGVLWFSVAPAAGSEVRADFDFFYRVTFEEDELDIEDFLLKLYSLRTITLIEDKL